MRKRLFLDSSYLCNLKQAILYIIHNAINYTPENSQIVLSITLHSENALLTISDNGPGVPDSSVPEISVL
jgi:signal transduction histidine kinase